MHKKRGKNKHIKHIHTFRPFSRLFFPALPPSAAGLASRQSSIRETAPLLGRPFLFLPYLFPRSIHIFLNLFSIPLGAPFRPSVFPPSARSLLGDHSTPVDSFADIFFLFCCCREVAGGDGKDWRRGRKNEWPASGWIMRKEIGVRRVKK